MRSTCLRQNYSAKEQVIANISPIEKILAQVEAAKPELDAYAPMGFGWYDRAVATAKTLVPWLAKEAPALRLYVEEVLNSPGMLRATWAELRSQVNAAAEVRRMDELLEREAVLLNFVAGDTVSSVVTGHLLAHYIDDTLVTNSKSDYPDLFIKTNDYSELPVRKRSDKKIGAAVRGKGRKPVRIPDGLEIKTSRNGAGIDCHYPHVGLHLLLAFDTTGERTVVEDVMVAFLRHSDYRITEPKTKATTLKASFSRSHFVSLLPSPLR